MGDFPPEMLRDPKTWGYCQLDLFGFFHCRSDVNKRATIKTWAIIVEDMNSGAVYLDLVSDYSAEAVFDDNAAVWLIARLARSDSFGPR